MNRLLSLVMALVLGVGPIGPSSAIPPYSPIKAMDRLSIQAIPPALAFAGKLELLIDEHPKLVALGMLIPLAVAGYYKAISWEEAGLVTSVVIGAAGMSSGVNLSKSPRGKKGDTHDSITRQIWDWIDRGDMDSFAWHLKMLILSSDIACHNKARQLVQFCLTSDKLRDHMIRVLDRSYLQVVPALNWLLTAREFKSWLSRSTMPERILPIFFASYSEQWPSGYRGVVSKRQFRRLMTIRMKSDLLTSGLVGNIPIACLSVGAQALRAELQKAVDSLFEHFWPHYLVRLFAYPSLSFEAVLKSLSIEMVVNEDLNRGSIARDVHQFDREIFQVLKLFCNDALLTVYPQWGHWLAGQVMEDHVGFSTLFRSMGTHLIQRSREGTILFVAALGPHLRTHYDSKIDTDDLYLLLKAIDRYGIQIAEDPPFFSAFLNALSIGPDATHDLESLLFRHGRPTHRAFLVGAILYHGLQRHRGINSQDNQKLRRWAGGAFGTEDMSGVLRFNENFGKRLSLLEAYINPVMGEMFRSRYGEIKKPSEFRDATLLRDRLIALYLSEKKDPLGASVSKRLVVRGKKLVMSLAVMMAMLFVPSNSLSAGPVLRASA